MSEDCKSSMFCKNNGEMSNLTMGYSTSGCKSVNNNRSSRMYPQFINSLLSGMAGMGIGVSIGMNSLMVSQMVQADHDFDENGYIGKNSVTWIVAFYCLGVTIGGFIQTNLVECIGFKWSMAIYDVFIFVGLIILAGFDLTEKEFVWAGRLVQGIGCGGLGLLVPAYIAQITDVDIKARMQVIHQMFICLGMFSAYDMGVISRYKHLVYLCTPWPLFHLLLVYFIPESPYYISDKERYECDPGVCHGSLRKTSQKNQDGMCLPSEFLHRNHVQRVAIIGTGLMVFQQLCGASMVLMYMKQVLQPFRDPDDNSYMPHILMICLGILQVIFCMIAIELVEFLGRKTLLLSSSLGMGTSLSVLIVYVLSNSSEFTVIDYTSYGILTSYACFYFIGWGPIVMVVFAEITTLNTVKWATGFFNACGQIILFLVVCIFYNEHAFMTNSVILWIFTVACFASALFVILCVPDTRGMTLEQIKEILENNN